MYTAVARTPKQQILATLFLHNGELLLPEQIQTETSKFFDAQYPLSVVKMSLEDLYREGQVICEVKQNLTYYCS